ncbi:MAG: DUF2207 domain-containing protein [Bacilli bacterium]|nr:DUF2207 domain-containing protein [Bacilli bacterium]
MITFIIYIVMLFFIFASVFAGKSGNKKTMWRIFAFALPLILIICMIIPVFKSFIKFDEGKDVDPADGFTISAYKVKLDVKEDNKIDVEEDITINWTEYGHHGIYKFTPEWFKYTSKNGKTIRRKSVLSNLRAEMPEYTYDPYVYYNDNEGIEYTNDENRASIAYRKSYSYKIDSVKDKPRIKIGDSGVSLSPGEKDYIIKYTYDMGSDPYDGYDEFIFHAYGDYWGTIINNPSIEVTMPKSIEGNEVHFFMDKYRKYDITKYVDYTIKGNKLVATFDRDKYSENRPVDYPYELTKSLTVDIELPENYFASGSNNYGAGSLILIVISLINLFIIFILWLIFGKDYHKKTEVVSYLPPRDLSSSEIGYVYNNVYNKKLVISLIIELAAEKIIDIREEKNKIYIKGQKPSKDDKDYEKKLAAYEKKVNKLNDYQKIVLDALITDDKEFDLKEHKTFYMIFKTIEEKLDKEYRWAINEKAGFILRYICLTLVGLSSIYMLLAYSTVEDLNQKIYFMYYVGFISVFIQYFLCFIMTRRSRFGEDIKTEVEGFKKFLTAVEKNKLEELVEEIPNYFYKILPYTYVLGISKKWIEKFEDIKSVDTTYIPFDTMDTMSSYIYTPSTSSSGSSSGCSSCGGGCSSCGGGCSSCGGGGSW